MKIKKRSQAFARLIEGAKQQQFYPYFQPVSKSWGTEVEVNGRRLVMIGSNDYLGLTHDPRVLESAIEAIGRWGSGPGGSRFLSGNMSLHDELEERLAHFVGKKMAVVHTTGFLTNLGVLSCLIQPQDIILYDRENHASIYEGCRASGARLVSFPHNDRHRASEKLAAAREKNPEGSVFLLTEGVFSMSGDVCELSSLVTIKDEYPDIVMYLDDAHGLGVMGYGGKGTASHFGVTERIDFIMGTFSKALASIGGFIASDDVDLLTYLKHHSKTLIFSAALPACNAATVIKCLEILEKEPERVVRLWENTARVREGYERIGLRTGESRSPIIPILIGSEDTAYHFAAELFNEGVFALPAVFPAVPRGQAIIRTAYMSTHSEEQIAFVMEVLDRLARKYRIRACDVEESGAPAAVAVTADDVCETS